MRIGRNFSAKALTKLFAMRNILFLGVSLVVCVLGCSGGGGFPVSGKVTFQDGTPVPRGQVTFISNTFSAGGNITADGAYTVTVKLPAGTYRVTVLASGDSPSSAMVDVQDRKPIKPLVDMKFNNPDTSGLVCEVKGKTTFPITVEPPK